MKRKLTNHISNAQTQSTLSKKRSKIVPSNKSVSLNKGNFKIAYSFGLIVETIKIVYFIKPNFLRHNIISELLKD